MAAPDAIKQRRLKFVERDARGRTAAELVCSGFALTASPPTRSSVICRPGAGAPVNGYLFLGLRRAIASILPVRWPDMRLSSHTSSGSVPRDCLREREFRGTDRAHSSFQEAHAFGTLVLPHEKPFDRTVVVQPSCAPPILKPAIRTLGPTALPDHAIAVASMAARSVGLFLLFLTVQDAPFDMSSPSPLREYLHRSLGRRHQRGRARCARENELNTR